MTYTHDPFFPVDIFVNIVVLLKPPNNQLTNRQSTSKQTNNKLKCIIMIAHRPTHLGFLLTNFFFNY